MGKWGTSWHSYSISVEWPLAFYIYNILFTKFANKFDLLYFQWILLTMMKVIHFVFNLLWLFKDHQYMIIPNAEFLFVHFLVSGQCPHLLCKHENGWNFCRKLVKKVENIKFTGIHTNLKSKLTGITEKNPENFHAWLWNQKTKWRSRGLARVNRGHRPISYGQEKKICSVVPQRPTHLKK